MKPGFELKQKQQLAITPKMQQLMRYLHMSTLEVVEAINEKLDDNPFLERSEDSDDEGARERQELRKAREEVRVTAQTPNQRKTGDTDFEDVFSMVHEEPSFKEHLHMQVCEHKFDERKEQIAHILIDYLDEQGYFKTDLMEIVENTPLDWRLEEDELKKVLEELRTFDPPGVATGDLRESFIYQLKQLEKTHHVASALDIVTNHYETFLDCRTPQRLSKKLKRPKDDMEGMMEVLKHLRPYPSFGFAAEDPTLYITPDVRVYKDESDGVWKVEPLKNLLPTLVIKKEYVEAIENLEDVDALFKSKAKEAEEFLNLLELRANTILRVAEIIVERQNEFFDKGELAMQPLTLADISKILDVNESTISRSVRQKYLTCPKGIFEFKYFFSKNVGAPKKFTGIDFRNISEKDLSSIENLPPLKDDELLIPESMKDQYSNTGDGDDPVLSNTAIKAQIQLLVNDENKKKPLSDEAIRSALRDMNIHVARRTVSKYREELGIPAAFRRKE